MADNYSVDDILAEVHQRRKREDGSPAAPKKRGAPPREKQPTADAAPFKMTGMTGEFEAPAPPDRPLRKARADEPTGFGRAPSVDPSATRIDLPAQRAEATRRSAPPDLGATQTIPTQRSSKDQGLEQRRQQKVKQFMQTPRPTFEEDEVDENEEEGTLDSLSQFFGGMRRVGPAAGAQGKGKHRPAAAGEQRRPTQDASVRSSRGAAADPAAKQGAPKQRDARPPKSATEARSPRERGASRAEPRRETFEGEYKAPAQAREVRGRLLRDLRTASMRTVLTGTGLVCLFYLSLCNLYPLPLLHPLCPEVDMRAFLITQLVLLLLIGILLVGSIGNGMIGLFTGKTNQDTPAALCTVAVIIHGIALVVVEEGLRTGEGSFYFVIAAAALFANAIGHRMALLRTQRGFAVVAADTEHVGDYLLTGRLAAELTDGQGFEEPTVSYPVKVEFPEDFMRLSASDGAEGFSRYLPYFFLCFSVLLGVVPVLFFEQTGITGLTIACVTLCMASPLTAQLVENFPLLRAAKALGAAGALVSGMEAVERFREMNTAAVDATGLYPVGSVELHGIKTFAESRIDEAIVDAASLMDQVDGLLKEIFLGMINNDVRILKPVEQITYFDRAGLSAEVDGKTVLVGNRALMEQFNITMPSKDYEKKFVRGDREILYLANSGEVTAMFILSYRTSPAVARWLDTLARREISLVVQSTDPNITEARIARDYHYPAEFIRVMPATLREQYIQTTVPRKRGRAYTMTIGGFAVRMRALSALVTLARTTKNGAALQVAGLILGYMLVAFLAFSGAIGSLGFAQILIYQLFWAMAISLLAALGKY